ncbi:MAG TPA: [FeFe] hydrogenase H-cluster maturation GTPase HydF [Bacteroidales bacterium]|nr:[FeFe] hydrogenase H-cluster maturation GTPase HydF [Bacteroidales bacterium]HPS70844.1 [FeFe] hydrogenase H-cluster maturation GTPase HydF [Bacteroidales bacterium]
MKGRDSQPHIGIFGKRNNGKSSLINQLTGQDIAIVSDTPGTTTDPVKKSIEIFGIGPTVIVDTPGIDDIGELGKKRVQKTNEVLKTIDLAIIVLTDYELGEYETHLIEKLHSYETPYILVNNKSDLKLNALKTETKGEKVISVSAHTGFGIQDLINEMIEKMPSTAYISHSLLEGIISKGDQVLLITPIDSEAPEGRMILPQVQMLRDVLDNDGVAIFIKEDRITDYLENNTAPKLVITDSQVFNKISSQIPNEIPFTSFSIVLAHHKGDFENYLIGTPQIENLQEDDHILILESCTHLTSCEDIGRFKIPRWLQEYTHKKLHFTVVPGLEDIKDYSKYKLVIQCGGCMITRKQILNRLKPAIEHNIPVTNYGMLIAYMSGIFNRATSVFR